MTIAELIAALEGAPRGSRTLDRLVRSVVFPDRIGVFIPPYTTEIDAALMLAPAGAHWVLYSDGVAYVGPDQEPAAEWQHDAPAMALCIAALRARMVVAEHAEVPA